MKATLAAKNLFLVLVMVIVNLFAPGQRAYGAESNMLTNAPSTQGPLSLSIPTRGPVGTVVAWGDNGLDGANVPAEVQAGAVAVSAGWDSMALLANGRVVTWGIGSKVPVEVQSGVVAIAAAGPYRMALKSDGTVVAWDPWGDLQSVPADAQSGVVAMSGGDGHYLALRADGKVVAWGNNRSGQATVPEAALSGVVAIAAGGDHSLALKSDGRVVAWGSNGDGQSTVPEGAQSGVVAIDAGMAHSLALKSDGRVIAWGYNSWGQATVPAALSGVVAIGAGDQHSLALKSDGTVVGWGMDYYGLLATVPPGARSGVFAIAAGNSHNLVLLTRQTGGVVAWGHNNVGQATVPPKAQSGVVAVAGGAWHSLALLSNGEVVAWGSNSNGQTSVPEAAKSGVVAIAAGYAHSLALLSTGEVIAWGINYSNQATVPEAAKSGVVAIAAGGVHSLALKQNGAVVAWGSNLGRDGSTVVGQSTPPSRLYHATAIAAGDYDSLALFSDGSIVGWGDPAYGQTTAPPEAQSGVVAIDAGDRTSLALLYTGKVVAWGIGTIMSNPPEDAQSDVVAIAEGNTFNLALRSDGRVVAWGFDVYDATHLPAEVQSGVLEIAAGWYHGLALKAGPAPATPIVTNVTANPASGSYTVGTTIDISVQFSQIVNVTGTPQLLLATSGAGTPAFYSSGSGSDTLTFRYTVRPGDNSADLDYVSSLALAFNGFGMISGAAGNAASLWLTAPGSAKSLGYNASIVIDTAGPVATLTTPANGSHVVCTGTETCEATPTFYGVAGTAPDDLPAATVRVYKGLEVKALWLVQTLTATAAADGTYSVAASAPLEPWSYTVQVEQRDALGNVGLSLPITFEVVPPTPVIRSVSPASLEAGSTDRTVTLLGTGFVEGSWVHWSEPATGFSEFLTPGSISEGQLTFSAPTGRLDVPKTVELWVYNPMSQGSRPQPYLITPAGVSVVNSDTAFVTDGTTATAEIPGVVSATGNNIGLVYVAQYSGVPVTSPTFPVGGHYVNVCLNGGNNFRTVDIKFCDPSFNSADSLYWWDPTAVGGAGGWRAVSPAAVFDASSGCVTFTVYQNELYDWQDLTKVGSPTTGQLTGTVFAVSHEDKRVATSLTVSEAIGTYGGSVTLEATLTTDSSMPVEGKAVSFTLDGTAVCGTPNTPACPSTDSAGVASLAGVELWTLEAGSYAAAVGASYAGEYGNAGDDGYLASIGTADLTVAKADATIRVIPYSVIYDGNAHTATGTATGVMGKPLQGLVLSGTTHTAVGTYNDTWTFTNANYKDAGGTLTNSILYPLPVMGGISPASATVGSDDVSVTITGEGFFPHSVVRWNDPDLVTTYVSSTQLTATIPAVDLNTVQTARITVHTPNGGGISDAQLFFVTQAAAAVTEQNVAGGMDPSASVTGVTASATGVGLLAVAEYDDNPGGTHAFTARGSYFSVYAGPDSDFRQVVVSVCGLTSGETLYWWDGSNWAAATPTDSDLRATEGCVRFTAYTASGEQTSAPTIEQLTGTVFVAGSGPTATGVAGVTSDNDDKAYTIGAAIDITVQFSDVVIVNTSGGVPTLALETGATDRTARYQSGSGTDALTFRYTVESGDISPDLSYGSVNALTLNGGTITDAMGNAALLMLPAPGAAGSLVATKDIVIDTTPPQTLIVSRPASLTNNISASFEFSGGDLDGSGIAGYECQLDNGDFVSCSSPAHYSGLSEGSHTYLVRAIDLAGNVDPSPSTWSWTIDTTLPTPTIELAAGQADLTNATPVNFTVIFSEPVIGFASGDVTLAVSTAPGALQGAVTEIEPLDGTTYNVAVSGMDGSGTVVASIGTGVVQDPAGNGNIPSITGAMVTYDITAPVVTGVTSTSADKAFTIGADIDIAVEFSKVVIVNTLDGDPTVLLETGATDRVASYEGGSDSHVLTFRYTVQAGDTSQDLDYVSANALSLNGSTIGDTLGNDALLTLPEPAVPGSLGANSDIVIDTDPPQTLIVSRPAVSTSDTFASFEFTGDDLDGSGIASYECQLDNGGFDTCSSPTDYTGLIEGGHTFQVQAIDRAGNVDDWPYTVMWMVDLTGPTVTIGLAAGQVELTNSTPVNFSVVFNELVDFNAGGVTLSGTAGPTVATVTGRGKTYNVAVSGMTGSGTVVASIGAGVVQDFAGNDNTASITGATVTYDITAPTVTGVTSANDDGAFTIGADIDITVQLSEAVTVNTSAGWPTLTLETGMIDRAASYLGGSGSDVLTFRYSVQAGDTSPDLDYVGANALSLNGGTIKDAARNDAVLTLPAPGAAGSLGANKALVIDTKSPITALEALGGTLGTNGWYSISPSITLHADDHMDGSGVDATYYQWVTYGGAAPSNSSLDGWTVYSAAFTAPAGDHDLYAFSLDNAGNWETPAKLGEFQVDGTAPTTTASASTSDGSYTFGEWTNLNVTVTLTGADGANGSGVALVYYEIDGATPPATYDTSNKPVISTEGEHEITFWSIDQAGNEEVRDSVHVKIDRTAPTAAITSGPAALTDSTSATFAFSGKDPGTASSGLDHIECQMNDAGWAACTSPWSYGAPLAAGDHRFEVRAVDLAGNVGPTPPASHTWHINVAPGVSNDWSAPSPNMQYSDTIPMVTITATDGDTAGSSLSAGASFTFNGGSTTPGLPTGLTLGSPAVVSEGPTSEVTWTVSGQMRVPVGSYEITIGVSDGVAVPTTTTFTIVVDPEDAKVRFHGGNPVAVRVAQDGGTSGTFSLEVAIREAYDAASGLEPNGEPGGEPGSIELAQVGVTLVPVGPGGGASPLSCSRAVYDSGYDARLAVTCDFEKVPVNTYVVQVTVAGGYYTGGGEDVLTVYDPSLGYTTGAAAFTWPGTDEIVRAGFTMAYNKKGTNLSGSLLLTRHTADGETLLYLVKSNALYGLSLGGDATMGWATFSGKCTYLGPGMGAPEGNYEFTVYVEDGYAGQGDRFWIEVRGKDGQVIAPASLPRGVVDNAQRITGGDIVVPYTGAKK